MIWALQLESEPERIALFRALHLGDMICATPAFRALRQRFLGAEITLIGLPWAAELMPRVPWLDRFVPFAGFPGLPEMPFDQARAEIFFCAARMCSYDLVVQMHGSGEISNDVAAALNGTRSLGFGPPGDHRLDLTLFWDRNEHEVHRWLRLVEALGCDIADTSVALSVLPEDWRACDRLLSELADATGPLVGIHPGANDAARRWPGERFAAVANALVGDIGARIVLTGSESELDLGRSIEGHLAAPVLNLIGRTGLGSFAAVVSRLDLQLTNDTGASHVAAAMRVPSVVLIGPTDPRRWAPLDRRLHAVVDAASVAGGEKRTALARLPLKFVLAACITQLQSAMETTFDNPRVELRA